MPAKRKRTRPPSLYRPTSEVRSAETLSDVLEVLRAAAPGAVLSRRLADCERVRGAAERDGLTEHAAAIRKYRDLLERFRKAGAMDAAIVEAMNLAAAFERLRADALLAAPVDAYKRSRAKPITSDGIIEKRIAARKPGERWADTAASLRMSERQLRERRKLIQEKRKSVRPPPEK